MNRTSRSELRLAEIKMLAIKTFGTESKANYWLNSTNLILGDMPISLAETESGAIEVKRVLYNIAFGSVV